MNFDAIRLHYQQHHKLIEGEKESTQVTLIWEKYITEVVDICMQDENFNTYSSREKALAFHFTLLQQFSNDEGFLSITNINKIKNFNILYTSIKSFNLSIIDHGISIGEIQNRIVIGNYYNQMLALCTFYITDFWIKDTSANKEQSDVAIDKIINWAYDIMAPNAIDSTFTLFQFLFQQVKK